MIIGLTGGIASGKSSVSSILKDFGALIIDADIIAKEIVKPYSHAWREIVAEFGEGILNPDKTIDRKKLGSIVFANPAKLKRLNEITHPRIIKEIAIQIEQLKQAHPDKVIVVDAALLVEAGMEGMVEQVWVVTVDPETQRKRLVLRDGLSEQAAEERIRSQMPLERKIKHADYVINNSGTLEDLRKQVQFLWTKIRS